MPPKKLTDPDPRLRTGQVRNRWQAAFFTVPQQLVAVLAF